MIGGLSRLTAEKMLDSLFDGVYFVDNNRTISYWNAAAERISGYSSQDVIGTCCADNLLRHIDSEGHHLCHDGCPLAATISDGRLRETSIFLHHKLGHRVPVSVRTSPVRDDNGAIIGAVEIFSDNSSSIQIIEQFEKLKQDAFLDPLTGVGNRRYGEMTLNSRFYDLEHHQFRFGLLFIDIDNFKHFNDLYGHAAGDDLLVMVARSISVSLRKIDVLARWGGEEFIVILPVSTSETVVNIAERTSLLVEHSYIERGSERLNVSISIGATMSRKDDTLQKILERADSQMYESKKSGKNRVSYVE